MNDERENYIKYRLECAKESLEVAELLWEKAYYNKYVNQVYYACFYAVSALLLKHGYSSSTHSGTQTLFAQHFIKTGKVSREMGKFYIILFRYRQDSDYKDNYRIDRDLAAPWLAQATEFVATLEQLINR